MDNKTNFSLEGKIALVTGASYGIGFAIANGYGRRWRNHRFNVYQAGIGGQGIELLTMKEGQSLLMAMYEM